MKTDEFKPRSESIRVRNHLDAIETALASGASRQDVYQWMTKENGLTMTYKAFITALQRQRLKRKEKQPATGAPSTPEPAKSVAVSVNPTAPVNRAVDKPAAVDPLVPSNEGKKLDAQSFATFNESFEEKFDISQFESSTSYKRKPQ